MLTLLEDLDDSFKRFGGNADWQDSFYILSQKFWSAMGGHWLQDIERRRSRIDVWFGGNKRNIVDSQHTHPGMIHSQTRSPAEQFSSRWHGKQTSSRAVALAAAAGMAAGVGPPSARMHCSAQPVALTVNDSLAR